MPDATAVLPPMLARMPAGRERALILHGLAEAMAADIARYRPELGRVYVVCQLCKDGGDAGAVEAEHLAEHILTLHLGGVL